MLKSRFGTSGLALLISSLLIPSGVFASSIAVNWTGDVYSIDVTTGEGSLIGPSGFILINSAASDSSDTVYTVDLYNNLITIDATTGIGTVATSLTTSISNGIRGIAFDSSDTLYAIADLGYYGAIGPDSLFSIDTTTGIVNEIGPSGQTSLQGLAFSSADKLFAWDIDVGLGTIDLSTGLFEDISPVLGGYHIQTLEFGDDGTLYGAAENALYTINTDSGETTLIGYGEYTDIRGLAVISSHDVPAPAPLALFAGGLLGSLFLRKRRT